MTSAALIISGGVSLTAIIGLIVIIRAYIGIPDQLVSYAKGQLAAEKNQIAAETERDAAVVARAKADAERDDAEKRLSIADARIVELLKEHAHETIKEIRTAPDGEHALDAFNRLLQKVPRLPSTNPGPSPTGTGDGNATAKV